MYLNESYKILAESVFKFNEKDKLMSMLKNPKAKLEKDQHIDEASMDEASALIGKDAVKEAIYILKRIYEKALDETKLIPESDTQQYIAAFKASRRSMLIFKTSYVVFILVKAVKDKFGKTYWLECKAFWVKGPGEESYEYGGAFAQLYHR